MTFLMSIPHLSLGKAFQRASARCHRSFSEHCGLLDECFFALSKAVYSVASPSQSGFRSMITQTRRWCTASAGVMQRRLGVQIPRCSVVEEGLDKSMRLQVLQGAGMSKLPAGSVSSHLHSAPGL